MSGYHATGGGRGGSNRGGGGRGSSSRGGSSWRGERGGRGGGGYSDRGGSSRGGRAASEAFAGDGVVPAPDAEITAVENATQQSLKSAATSGELPDLSQMSLIDRHPKRPGYGTKGIAVTLWANFFHLTPGSGLQLFRYHVDVQPDTIGRKRKRIVQLFMTEGQVSRIGAGLASDFKSTIISCERLISQDLVDSIKYRFDEEDTAPQEAQTYTVALTETGSFDIADLIGYLTSSDARAAFPQREEVTQALNIVLGHHNKAQKESTTLSIASNRHYPLQGQLSERFDLGAGLLAWRGYFTSIRTATSRILLNLQVKHTAVYEAIPLGALIDKFQYANGPNLYKLEKFLKLVRVETTHLPEKKNRSGARILRIKTIGGLASRNDGSEHDQPPRIAGFGANAENVEFFQATLPGSASQRGRSSRRRASSSNVIAAPQPGRYVSVSRYFETTYGRRIEKKFPVVNVGNRKDPSYLPVDVCRVLPGQPAGANLSPEQTSRMIGFAVRKPNLNAQSIAQRGTAVLGLESQNATLARFRIAVSAKMTTVPGRILPGPNVKYRNDQLARTRFGSWNMNGIKFVKSGANLPKWSVVVVTDEIENWGLLVPTLQEFHKELARNGVNAAIPAMKIARWFSLKERTVDDVFQSMATAENAPTLLLVILPKVDVAIYNAVKYAGDVKHGIHTVCVVRGKLTKLNRQGGPDLQYFANVALKFNLKLGGNNQCLDRGKLGIIDEGKTMLVGVDVTHPSPGSASTAPSVAGMVASIDKDCGQFPAIIRTQEPRKEMVTDLREMFKTRLQLWKKHNNQKLPENVIIYRDGVSEGQYQIVLDDELPPIKEACREIYSADAIQKGLPYISIIICGKRHNTRFYPTKNVPGQIDERSSNNPNGTVVDRGVTEPRNWDFYLQAHTAIQGTARPAHYYIVHDEIFARSGVSRSAQGQGFQNAADVLEDLTHNLSYMFGRATKAVSICPPAYYADLLCERSRCYLSGHFAPDSEAAPSSAATSSVGGQNPDVGNISIHPRLRDTMFYI